MPSKIVVVAVAEQIKNGGWSKNKTILQNKLKAKLYKRSKKNHQFTIEFEQKKKEEKPTESEEKER